MLGWNCGYSEGLSVHHTRRRANTPRGPTLRLKHFSRIRCSRYVRSMPVPLPDPCRLTRHALAVIARAVEDAQAGPIKPTPGIRLALGWLSFQRLAEPWRVEQF